MLVMHNNPNTLNEWSVPGLKEMLLSDLINMLSEACSLCIGFLLLVRMEHCYPTFYNIFRLSYHSVVNELFFLPMAYQAPLQIVETLLQDIRE